MSLIRIFSIFFFVVAIGLAALLVSKVKYKIDEDKRIARQEAQVINKLKMIRDAQIAYQSVTSDYTGDWDTLINFLDTGHIYIIQRRERVYTLSYGRDSSIVRIDTIGKVPVKDSLFVIKEPVSSLVKGTVDKLEVVENQRVEKGDLLFSVTNPNGKSVKVRAPREAIVKGIHKNEGSAVDVEETVLMIHYPRIGDVAQIPYLPGSETERFDLFAGSIVRGNVVVDVFEAKDTNPVNPKRRKRGEENPLRVGSRTDVSTSGNWELAQ